MKAKVEIEYGKSKIVLTPENEFEKTMLSDAYKEKGGLDVFIDKKYHNYGDTDYSLRVELTDGLEKE